MGETNQIIDGIQFLFNKFIFIWPLPCENLTIYDNPFFPCSIIDPLLLLFITPVFFREVYVLKIASLLAVSNLF